MGKKDKYAEEFDKLKREIVRDQVQEIFDRQPAQYRQGLEEVGFSWFDDDGPSEEEEERTALPVNANQKLLVDYFEGALPLADDVFAALKLERYADNSNYPLIRRYFRAGNQPLKSLIIDGLQRQPTDIDLLCDLALFHEFNPMLSELVDYFTKACMLEEDHQKFAEIVEEFQAETTIDGYDALLALREIFDSNSDKGKIIDFLASELSNRDHEHLTFQTDEDPKTQHPRK
jgi:hypothetical protein